MNPLRRKESSMRALVRLLLLGLMVTMIGPGRAAAQAGPTASTDKAAGDADAGTDGKPHNEPLANIPTGGTLVVTATSASGRAISGGTVMVDEEPRGKLAQGKLTLQYLAEGRYTVAIEADGYRRFEQTVTVRAGEPASLDAVLRDNEAPASLTSSSRTAWRMALGASVVMAIAGGAYAVHSSNKVDAHLAPSLLDIKGAGGASVSSEECGKSYATILNDSRDRNGVQTVASFNEETFQRACTWRTRSYLGLLASTVGVLGTVISLIVVLSDLGSPEGSPAGSHRKTAAVAIVPLVTPAGGGASFSLRW
jgi:PEGA domain